MRLCDWARFDRRWLVTIGAVATMLMFVIGRGSNPAAAADFIHAQGRQLVDGQGQRFDIKGINLGNWLVPEGYMFKFTHALSPTDIAGVIDKLVGPEKAAQFWTRFRDTYIAREDIEFLKAVGFNTVRVPLNWRLFVQAGSDGKERMEGPGWALLDRLVQWCRETGIRAIIDLHAAPGGQTGVNHDDGPGYPLTFYLPDARRLTVALWQKLAEHYRDETAVLGYDLLNEPISPYSDVAYLNPQLEPFYRDIVAAIRRADSNHMVLLGGAQWDTNFAVFGRPFDNNALYTFHKFWANPTRDAVQGYVNFSNLWNVPVIIGETGEFNDAWNAKFRQLQERFGMGWIFWPYKNLDSPLAVVTVQKPAGWDRIAEAGSSEHPVLPSPAEAQAVLDAYLEAVRFKNVHVNASYIQSLGLKVP